MTGEVQDIPGVVAHVRLHGGRVVQVRAWGFGRASAHAGLLVQVLREFVGGLRGSDTDGLRALAGAEQLIEASLPAAELAHVTLADYGDLLDAVVRVNNLRELVGKLLGLRLTYMEVIEAAQAQAVEVHAEAGLPLA